MTEERLAEIEAVMAPVWAWPARAHIDEIIAALREAWAENARLRQNNGAMSASVRQVAEALENIDHGASFDVPGRGYIDRDLLSTALKAATGDAGS